MHNWQVGATLSWPFLNGGADEARAAELRGAVEQTRAARAAEVLQVRADVEQAALAVLEAHARRDVSQVLVGQAQENLELAEGRYQAGVGSIVELTDAQAALTSARAQQVRSGYDPRDGARAGWRGPSGSRDAAPRRCSLGVLRTAGRCQRVELTLVATRPERLHAASTVRIAGRMCTCRWCTCCPAARP